MIYCINVSHLAKNNIKAIHLNLLLDDDHHHINLYFRTLSLKVCLHSLAKIYKLEIFKFREKYNKKLLSHLFFQTFSVYLMRSMVVTFYIKTIQLYYSSLNFGDTFISKRELLERIP